MDFDQLTDQIWSRFAHDLAIDLGTANILVHVREKGIVIREPSVVAQHSKTKKIYAIGREAKHMMGRTPQSIVTIKPLRDGVISDYEVAEALLAHLIKKVHKTWQLWPPKISRPRVVIGVPADITEVERKAVLDAVFKSGARRVYLVEEPMAAAIGATLPVLEPVGSMIVDIGGGTTEIAVISLGGIVASQSLRIGGDEMDETIMAWAKSQHNLLIGQVTAEELKIKLGSVWPSQLTEPGKDEDTFYLRGRDLSTGLPREVKVKAGDITPVLRGTLNEVIFSIQRTIEDTPPELVNDLYQKGLIVTGGGSLLRGVDQLVADATGVPVRLADDPLTTVVRGCAKILEDPTLLVRVAVT